MYKLVIEDDDGNKTVVPVIRDEISIGRQDGNTIRLTERNVSRKHARLLREDGRVFIEELSARYGIRKNGEKIAGRQPFTVGDVFLIGDYRLTLLAEGADAEAAKNGAAVANGAPAPEAKAPPKDRGFTNVPTQITHREDLDRRSQNTEILPAQPAKLVVVSSNFAGQEFPLANKEMVIGRAEDCDIIIDHRSVSQKHAKIVRELNGNYKIVDLNSKNGVKVSGEDYRAVHLKRGDIVELGHVRFRFVEPGENYVFTPQAIIEDSFPTPETKSNKSALIVATVLAVVVVVVGAVLVVKTFSESKNPATDGQTNAAAANGPVQGAPKAAQPPTEESKVEAQIARAKQKLDAGNAGAAIELLKVIRESMNPTADEGNRINELLSEARREKPLEDALEDARQLLDTGRFVDALREIQKIPPGPSITRTIMEKDDLPSKVIEQALSKANAALQDGDVEQASQLAEEILLYQPDNQAAAEIKASAAKAVKVAAKAKAKSKPKPKPKKPAMSEEEQAARQAEAGQLIVKGDAQGAIKACWDVKTKYCYRIVGTAYKTLGEIEKSCVFFKKAGMTPPHCQ